MREPKFSDAPCFGKEFDPLSKICGVCLANRLCRRKSYGKSVRAEPTVLTSTRPRPVAPSGNLGAAGFENLSN